MEDIILVGFGGHGRSVADCIERGKKYNIYGYTDICNRNSAYAYLGNDNMLEQYVKKVENCAICIGYLGKSNVRRLLYEKLVNIGFKFPTIIDPSAIVSDSANIDNGTFIGKGAIVNANSNVGKLCIINNGAVVEHDCSIGEYSHISVHAVLCGNVTVGKECFLGANSTIIQGLSIGSGSIIGAGSVIVHNIGNDIRAVNKIFTETVQISGGGVKIAP